MKYRKMQRKAIEEGKIKEKIGISQTEHVTLGKKTEQERKRKKANGTGGNVLAAIQISNTQTRRKRESLGTIFRVFSF
jgi:hypothetical protein